jgi:hypothetical protein
MLDTDVVIDYLRGQPDAVSWLESLTDRPFVSVISIGELYAGVREGAERTALEQFVALTRVIPVDLQTAERAGLYVRQFRKSHGVMLPDALIGATSEELGVQLATLNSRHFPMLPDVVVPYQKA